MILGFERNENKQNPEHEFLLCFYFPFLNFLHQLLLFFFRIKAKRLNNFNTHGSHLISNQMCVCHKLFLNGCWKGTCSEHEKHAHCFTCVITTSSFFSTTTFDNDLIPMALHFYPSIYSINQCFFGQPTG